MSENSSPITQNNEINKFKNEFLKKIRELETKITSQINNKELILNTDYKSFNSKIDLLINNNKELTSIIAAQKVKLERVSELEAFKNKIDSMLISHEVRIKNNVDEIGKIKTKYDKIISDNLFVPGYIGSGGSYQFRNVSEYLSYNIFEVSRLKMEKEQLKRDIKELKGKWDGIMKSMIHMNDNTAKLCNNYTDNKQEYFQQALEQTKKELNEKSLDMRVVITKYQNDSDQKMVELREEINKLIKSESDLHNLINDNFYICEKQHEEMKKNISNGDENIMKHKIILDNLEEKTTKLQERIKLTEGLSSKVTRLYEIVKSDKFPNNINLNMTAKTVSQSPPPRRIRRKNSNPDLIKINSGINNINNIKLNNNDNEENTPSSKNLLQKSVRNVRKINLDLINNMPSKDEKNKNKEIEEKQKKIKINISQDSNNISQEKVKLNDITKKEAIKAEIKEKVKEEEKEVEKEEMSSPRIIKANQGKTKQELPKINSGKKRNKVAFKPLEIDFDINKNKNNNNNINIYENRNNYNNMTTQISNDSHTQTQIQTQTQPQTNNNLDLGKFKKMASASEKETPTYKVVSLDLSPNLELDDKNTLSKSRRPTKVKYDIVNSLINDYRAKVFARAHSIDMENGSNNQMIDMPKRVSQAFGRTVYTFYFQKDAMNVALANKNVNGFGYNGPKRGSTLKNSMKSNENNNMNNNNIKLVKK